MATPDPGASLRPLPMGTWRSLALGGTAVHPVLLKVKKDPIWDFQRQQPQSPSLQSPQLFQNQAVAPAALNVLLKSSPSVPAHSLAVPHSIALSIRCQILS